MATILLEAEDVLAFLLQMQAVAGGGFEIRVVVFDPFHAAEELVAVGLQHVAFSPELFQLRAHGELLVHGIVTEDIDHGDDKEQQNEAADLEKRAHPELPG